MTTFKVGGLRFFKLGRITLMFCISKPKLAKHPKRFITSDDGVLVLGWPEEDPLS